MAFSRKSVVRAVGGLILVGGIGAVGGYTGFGISERAYRHELAMSAAAGLPSQLETYRRTADPADNAADFYSEAASTWNRFKKAESSTAESMLKGIGPDYSIDTAEKDLAKIATAISLVVERQHWKPARWCCSCSQEIDARCVLVALPRVSHPY